MYPYYGHYYSHEDYVSTPFQDQAYDPGFIDERLMGPPGPPQGFPGPPGFPPSFPQQGQGQGQGKAKWTAIFTTSLICACTNTVTTSWNICSGSR